MVWSNPSHPSSLTSLSNVNILSPLRFLNQKIYKTHPDIVLAKAFNLQEDKKDLSFFMRTRTLTAATAHTSILTSSKLVKHQVLSAETSPQRDEWSLNQRVKWLKSTLFVSRRICETLRRSRAVHILWSLRRRRACSYKSATRPLPQDCRTDVNFSFLNKAEVRCMWLQENRQSTAEQINHLHEERRSNRS